MYQDIGQLLFRMCSFDVDEGGELQGKGLRFRLIDMKSWLKQAVLAFIAFCICCVSLYSADALQRVYAARDDEYKDVMLLCQAAGVRYPAVTPVTASELISSLERIPDDAPALVLERRDALMNELKGGEVLFQNDIVNFDIDVYGGLNALLHGDIDTYEYFVPYKDLDPMLAGEMKVSFAGVADLYLEFMEKDPLMALDKPMGHWTNFITLVSIDDGHLGVFRHLSQSFQPFKVGLSTGNEWFNFQIARNRQSFGHGVTGNLLITDNFSYEEYVRATFSSGFFNYYLDITHFDQQNSPLGFDSFRLSGKHQLRAMHRFEFTLTDSLVFSISLGSMFQSDSVFDWRLLIPLMIPHSFNDFSEDGTIKGGDEANNILGLDVSWSFAPSWMMHFEIVMDQFQLSYEKGNFMPNAFGLLLNMQNTSVIGEGLLHSYIEGVYTMPYLYLNRAKIGEDGRDYNYDWILGHGLTGGSEIQYSGYPEGPDTVKLELGSKYMFSYGLSVGGNIGFMLHGIHGIAFEETFVDTVNEGWRDEHWVTEYTLSIGLSVAYDFDFGLSLGIDAYMPCIWNYKNVEGSTSFIPQAFVFVRYSFL